MIDLYTIKDLAFHDSVQVNGIARSTQPDSVKCPHGSENLFCCMGQRVHNYYTIRVLNAQLLALKEAAQQLGQSLVINGAIDPGKAVLGLVKDDPPLHETCPTCYGEVSTDAIIRAHGQGQC